jgi:hypothetical protein
LSVSPDAYAPHTFEVLQGVTDATQFRMALPLPSQTSGLVKKCHLRGVRCDDTDVEAVLFGKLLARPQPHSTPECKSMLVDHTFWVAIVHIGKTTYFCNRF